jgi:hypothetical protein
MYIPTTFFGQGESNLIISASGEPNTNFKGFRSGSFLSSSIVWKYLYWGDVGAWGDDLNGFTGSLTIYSGSTNRANVIIIGGGGGAGSRNTYFGGTVNATGGGGGGGVVQYTNFPLVPGTYDIIVGAGGSYGSTSSSPYTGSVGETSYLKLPNNITYTPFNTSYLTAYGGGGGGVAFDLGVGSGSRANGPIGASNGGICQARKLGANSVNSNLGGGQGGLNGLNQGNLAGSLSADGTDPNIRMEFTATGGGGWGAASLPIQSISGYPYFTNDGVSNGGDGAQLKIYPINGNTASYFAGGGGSYGTPNGITRVSAAGLGGDISGGGGQGSSGDNAGTEMNGYNGLVYIEYPVRYVTGAYPYLRYTVDVNCNSNNATEVWSETNLAYGFYNIGGIEYRITSSATPTYTTEITSATASFCPVRYTYIRYDVDGSCNLTNPTQVWSEKNNPPYSTGFYTIGGIEYKLETNTHTNYTTQIYEGTPSTCPTTTTTAPPFPVTGLVLWNDTTSLTGSVWYDLSLNGNNGLVSGSALTLSGSLGYAFNGTDNYVTYPTTLVGQPSSSYTLQYYGTLPSESIDRDFFNKNVYSNGWDILFEVTTSPDRFVFRDIPGSDKRANITTVLGQKQLITITADAATDNLQLYVGPTFITNFTGGGVNDFNLASVPFVFGFNTDTATTYWKGAVSDLLLFNKVLTATEVSASYAILSVY